MLDVTGASINKGLTSDEQQRYSRQLLAGATEAIQNGNFDNIEPKEFAGLRALLEDLSSNFAERSWQVGALIDQLGLFTFETFVAVRERTIKAQAIAELSTPVIKVWNGILASPLVGSIDSMRAKDIMEKLLEAVVAQEADVVILDISALEFVDSFMARVLDEIATMASLMGTRAVVVGMSPNIAIILMDLGLQLGKVPTARNLERGIELLKELVADDEGEVGELDQ